MKKKLKQPKMDYATKMTATILEVMEISNKDEYNKLIEQIKILLKEPQYLEIDRGCDIMEYLADNQLFCRLACSILGDCMRDLPQFKDVKSPLDIN